VTIRKIISPDVMAFTHDPSTQKAEARESQAQTQLGLHKETQLEREREVLFPSTGTANNMILQVKLSNTECTNCRSSPY
jgi:hypothetical protein